MIMRILKGSITAMAIAEACTKTILREGEAAIQISTLELLMNP